MSQARLNMNLDLDINVKETLNKFNDDNLDKMRQEITKYKTYELERLVGTEIIICQGQLQNNQICSKNAIYKELKTSKCLCWYHGLMLTKSFN